MSIATLPDTAMLIQKRPFFIPDYTQQCMVQLCVCVRINRLGRSIHEQFAQRYYDSQKVALGCHFVARDLLNTLSANHQPWDKAIGFDNAVVVAEKPCNFSSEETLVSMRINDTTFNTQLCITQLLPIINKQIAHISSYYTLRQGDILLFPLKIEEKQVYIDNRITLSANDEDIVQFNVK